MQRDNVKNPGLLLSSEIPDGEVTRERGPQQGEPSLLEVVHPSCFPSALPAPFRMDTTACSCPDLVHGPCLEAKLLKTAEMTALGFLFVLETETHF